MGKKHDKTERNFTRLCKNYNTTLEGYHIPVGAIYGRITDTFYIWLPVRDNIPCKKTDNGRYTPIRVLVSKRTWGNNANLSDEEKHRRTRWNCCLLPMSHEWCKTIIPLTKTEKISVMKKQIWEDPRYAYIKALIEKWDCSSIVPRMRTPQKYMGRSWSQSSVDGKTYNEVYADRNNPLPEDYVGMSTTWNEVQGCKCSFGSFDGITDTIEAKRRDSMKVDQTKCRPVGKGSKAIKNYNGPKSKDVKISTECGKTSAATKYAVRKYAADAKHATNILHK